MVRYSLWRRTPENQKAVGDQPRAQTALQSTSAKKRGGKLVSRFEQAEKRGDCVDHNVAWSPDLEEAGEINILEQRKPGIARQIRRLAHCEKTPQAPAVTEFSNRANGAFSPDCSLGAEIVTYNQNSAIVECADGTPEKSAGVGTVDERLDRTRDVDPGNIVRHTREVSRPNSYLRVRDETAELLRSGPGLRRTEGNPFAGNLPSRSQVRKGCAESAAYVENLRPPGSGGQSLEYHIVDMVEGGFPVGYFRAPHRAADGCSPVSETAKHQRIQFVESADPVAVRVGSHPASIRSAGEECQCGT